MEIVNYVGFDNRSNGENLFAVLLQRISLLFKSQNIKFEKKAKTLSFDSVSFIEKIKNFLCKIGNKSSLISLALVLASFCVFCSIFIIKTVDYALSFTGPLSLPVEKNVDSDLEMLDVIMANFALDKPEFDAEGTLFDAKNTDISALFKQPVKFQTYKVQKGDTISGITKKFGLTNISTLIAVNDIGNVRQLAAGQKLKIPSMDGLFYTVQSGNSLQGICSKFNVTMEEILDVNELETSVLTTGQQLFIPGARMDSKQLQKAMGELFKNPLSTKYRLSSYFGPRADPFTGVRSNHTGIDMACPQGSAIMASASGTVAVSGFHPVYGNYVIIKHSNGYQTLYGHMSKILVKKGQWISQGSRIGLVGSTGYSTGPHLHFSVYKNGRLVNPLSLIKK